MQSIIKNLSEIAKKYPLTEKYLICSDYHSGHQLLELLARSGAAWVNFHPTTSISLATDIAQKAILEKKYTLLSKTGIEVIIDGIFGRLSADKKLKYFRKFSINKGIIEALAQAVCDLRILGLLVKDLKEDAFIDKNKVLDIKWILSSYEKILKDKNFLDTSGLLKEAIISLDSPSNISDRIYIVLPRCYTRGLEREFINKLTEKNLIVLSEGDAVGMKKPRDVFLADEKQNDEKIVTDSQRLRWLFKSLQAPKPVGDDLIRLFTALGTRNEIAHVIRSIGSENISLDEVEIAYTSSREYALEIHQFCQKLGLPVTFAEGLPSGTSGSVSVLLGLLLWMKDNYNEIYLRRMLESGYLNISVEVKQRHGSHFAHLLRLCGVGWGKDRYQDAIKRKSVEVQSCIDEAQKENEGEKTAYFENLKKELSQLESFCKELLSILPDTSGNKKIDFPSLCNGCIQFLERHISKKNEVDNYIVNNIKRQLILLSEFDSQKIPSEEAIEKILRLIKRLHIQISGPRPGHLHVCSYRNAGQSGRKHLFLVGLDEVRFPPRGVQDPILLDEERKSLHSDLELSEDKVSKAVFDMASAIANIPYRITASFSCFDLREECKVFPSLIMLQIMRIKEGDASIDYTELFKRLGEPIGFAANELIAKAPLTETDWWLSKIAETIEIKNGLNSLSKVYQMLTQGLDSCKKRKEEEFSEFDGLIKPKGNDLDLRKNKEKPISPTRLETAAKCPYQYFIKTILKVSKPDEIKKDLNQWLNPLERGKLLHDVYQKFSEAIINSKYTIFDNDQRSLVKKILDETIQEYKDIVPSPSELIFHNEYQQLYRDMDVFLQVNSMLEGKPVQCEMSFGMDDKPVVEVDTGENSSISLKGRVDRVDQADSNTYNVWDYKTGSAHNYAAKGYIHGGEQLQHSLYGNVVEKVFKKKNKDAKVKKSGYIFPTEAGTRHGKNIIIERDPHQKDKWQEALTTLLDLISQGGFLQVFGHHCEYCDYLNVCMPSEYEEHFSERINNSSNKAIELWRRLKEYE